MYRVSEGNLRLKLFKPLACALAVTAGVFAATVPVEQAHARQAYAGIVIDANTDRVIYARSADKRRYPASLTKMMTLYVLFEDMRAGRFSYSSKLKVSRHAAGQPPSKLGLKPGQTIRVRDAIRALVTKSANDVAVVVAENISGSEWKFARRMTKTARRIGMKRTTFRNASGLPHKKQVTTARDMARLGIRLQRDFPKFYKHFATRKFKFRGRTYGNHNRLLGRMKGIDGIKTGYTRASGYNLTSSIRRGKRHLVGVVLGGRTGKSRNAQMRKILSQSMRKASKRRSKAVLADIARSRKARVQVASASKKAHQSANTLTAADRKIAPKKVGKPLVITEAAAKPVVASAIVPPLPKITETVSAAKTVTEDAPETTASVKQTWSIQIGAFSRKEDATRRLSLARKTGVKALSGKKAIAMAFHKAEKTIYRARFAGFNQKTARLACNALSRKSINCFPLAP